MWVIIFGHLPTLVVYFLVVLLLPSDLHITTLHCLCTPLLGQKTVRRVNMDSYGAADDPGVTFCVGHHEPNRSLVVTPQVVSRAHESNVSLRVNFCCKSELE